MELHFYKYQGAGNDFIMVDDRQQVFDKNDSKQLAHLCDRKFGIGADGLILLRVNNSADFEMIYFNSDGNEASMCGNGGRCIAAFAHHLGLIKKQTMFVAADGVHEAIVESPDYIKLKMNDVSNVEQGDDFYYLNTGSPHYVKFVHNLIRKDVYAEGRAIRYNDRFKNEGTNVNFVELENGHLFIRTYERGVENETLACGTGIVAASIAASIYEGNGKTSYPIQAMGGNLNVRFTHTKSAYTDIWLEGPAEMVFEGKIVIRD